MTFDSMFRTIPSRTVSLFSTNGGIPQKMLATTWLRHSLAWWIRCKGCWDKRKYKSTLTPSATCQVCEIKKGLQCHLGRDLKPQHSGETLSMLHAFCRDRPGYHIAFVHNHWQDVAQTPDFLLHLTEAVTSQGCTSALDQGYNVCSLFNAGVFDVQFAGNVFYASCSYYIQKLHAPKLFEKENGTNQSIG